MNTSLATRIFVAACAAQAALYAVMGVITLLRPPEPDVARWDSLWVLGVAAVIVAGLLLRSRWRRPGEMLALIGTLAGLGMYWVVMPPILSVTALVSWLFSLAAPKTRSRI